MKTLSVLVAMTLVLFSTCEVFESETPIPKQKESFIGEWVSPSGYRLMIRAEGIATITQLVNAKDPEYDTLNIKVAPPTIDEIHVKFRGDSVLLVIKPLQYAREFRIDRNPYFHGSASKMVLNGVTLTKKPE